VPGEPVCWFKSQVDTSSTYGGLIAGMVTGGLNFQIERHLYPWRGTLTSHLLQGVFVRSMESNTRIILEFGRICLVPSHTCIRLKLVQNGLSSS
jgi:hypothetical protein